MIGADRARLCLATEARSHAPGVVPNSARKARV